MTQCPAQKYQEVIVRMVVVGKEGKNFLWGVTVDLNFT